MHCYCILWQKFDKDSGHAREIAAARPPEKRYDTAFGTYLYRDVPAAAFPYGTTLHVENGYSFVMASPEKAVCDMLYALSPCANRTELKRLLFDDLRIDMRAFEELNRADMLELAALYDTRNHRLLVSLMKEMMRHEQHH